MYVYTLSSDTLKSFQRLTSADYYHYKTLFCYRYYAEFGIALIAMVSSPLRKTLKPIHTPQEESGCSIVILCNRDKRVHLKTSI